MTIHTASFPTDATATRSHVGPTARLESLPQLDGGLPPTLADVDDHLARVERARLAQLGALPPVPSSVVAAAHRRLVEHIVAQVRDARARVRAGTYGSCVHCGAAIRHALLEREPWQADCGSCGTGSH